MPGKQVYKKAPTVYDFSQDDMYNAWVQNNRRGAETARQLGMNEQTLYYHIRQHRFHERYEAEFTNSAASIRRIAIVDASNKLQGMINVLYDIATDPEQKAFDRVQAVKVFLEMFPKEQAVIEDQPRYVEAAARVIPASELTPGTDVPHDIIEMQVMEELENNVQNTAPMRRG